MSANLALHFLGPPKIELNNVTAMLERRKALALLAYLAVGQDAYSREYLSALLWPDYDQEKAFASLRHLLWEIQQALGNHWISAGRDRIELKQDGAIWLDVSCFESLIAQSRIQNDISLRISLLSDSARLYRDHFLAGFHIKDTLHFNDWAFAKSEELRHQFAGVLKRLTADYASVGRAEIAIPHAQRLVGLDPLNEESQRQLMRLFIEAGHPNAALKQYQACERILRKELGVDPQPETRELYKQIRKGELKPTQTVEQKGTPAPQNNLPFLLSKFIGREKELEEIAGIITDHRLVTLVGAGGIGKTRLSLKMGEQNLRNYADGVWLVELASIGDPSLVAQTVAKLFHIVEQGDESLAEKLPRVLQTKNILLILDNCEHLLDACAQLADGLLKHCPNMNILATSREPLGINGEALYHVPPLGLPDVKSVLEKMLEFESVQLFIERARLVQERFALTMENALAITKICQRLDGIPLAIELAAARVNLLSTEQIASRLNESFNLLTGGGRTTLPRHQTIRASIDWSWNLLSEPERILLRRLSVFAGSWTLEGAEAVGAGDSITESDVLHLLNSLLEKSLVSLISGSKRYHMLEVVREYALGRSKEANEEEAARNRHLDFYVKMVEQAEPKLLGKEQGEWMKRLSEDQANIIAANDWCNHSEFRTEQRFRLLGGTRYYWAYAGLAKLGFKIYREALTRHKEDAGSLAQGLTFDGAAICALMLGDPSLSEYIEKSIPIFQAHEDHVRLAMALTRKALWQTNMGNHVEAIRLYHEAITIGRQTEDRRPISSALNNLAELYRLDEEYEKAMPLYEEALAIDREREDSTGIVLGLINVARNALTQDNFEHVQSQLAEACQIAEDAYLTDYGQGIVETSAILRFVLGEHLQGVQLFGAAEMELRRKGYRRTQPDEMFTASWTTKMSETLGREEFAAAMAEGSRIPFAEAMKETREWLRKGGPDLSIGKVAFLFIGIEGLTQLCQCPPSIFQAILLFTNPAVVC